MTFKLKNSGQSLESKFLRNSGFEPNNDLELMNGPLDLRDRFLQVATSFRRFKSNQNKNISCSRQSQQQIHRRIINELK